MGRGDPLAGQREGINRGELRMLLFRGDRPCPVEQGQTFRLRSCMIEIGHIDRRLVKRKWAWVCNYIRSEPNLFLGSHSPSEASATKKNKTWRHCEEHNYGTSDVFDAGPIVDSSYQHRLSREAAVGNAVAQKQQQKQAEKLRLERRLITARRKGSRTVLHTVRQRIERLDRAA